MSVVRWVLLALVTALATVTVWRFWGPRPDAHAEGAPARFYCSMHPQIRSPQPGTCPICHMDLEPIPEARSSDPSASAAHAGHDHAAHPEASGSPPSASSAAGASAPSASAAASGAALSEVTAVGLSPDQQRAIGLVTAPAEEASLGDRLRVPGVIAAPETGLSQVRVRSPGFIERVAVRQTGVRVRRGQPLAYVYSPEVYRAQEEFLTASRWSGAGRAGDGAASPTTELAAAARRGLELLGMSRREIDEVARTGQPQRAVAVRAPASGYVTRYGAILGARAELDTVLYEIADLGTVWVIASVHERDLGLLRVGTPATFSLSSGAEEPLTGKVDLIEPLLDEATRTSRVRLVLRNPDGRLRPGQYGQVQFELPEARALFVPRDAVIQTGEHAYVYVATGDDHFEPRRVTVGLLRDGRLEIRSGLVRGEPVVTRGNFMLDSESRLRASLFQTTAPAGSAR